MVAFTNEEISFRAQEFLSLTSKVQKLYSYFTDFNAQKEEEKKDDLLPECFDWLFCDGEIPQAMQKTRSSVKNRDTKILNLKVDL